MPRSIAFLPLFLATLLCAPSMPALAGSTAHDVVDTDATSAAGDRSSVTMTIVYNVIAQELADRSGTPVAQVGAKVSESGPVDAAASLGLDANTTHEALLDARRRLIDRSLAADLITDGQASFLRSVSQPPNASTVLLASPLLRAAYADDPSPGLAAANLTEDQVARISSVVQQRTPQFAQFDVARLQNRAAMRALDTRAANYTDQAAALADDLGHLMAFRDLYAAAVRQEVESVLTPKQRALLGRGSPT